MARALFLIVVFLVTGSCTESRHALSVRLAARENRDGPADASSFYCYFASIKGNRVRPGKAPACLGFGNTSSLVSLDDITTKGAEMKVPVATKLEVKVFGVATASACEGMGASEDMFEGGLRPEIYEVGSREAQLQGGGEIEIPNTYDSSTAVDLGGCDAVPGNHSVASILPISAPRRGGYTLTVNGTGFESGSTVKVGGADCPNVFVTDETQLTCTAPQIAAQIADVSVRLPTGATATKPGALEAYRVVYVSYIDSTSTFVRAYKEDVVSGVLNLLSSQPAFEAAPGANLIINPKGTWLLSLSTLANFTPYQVNPASGELTKLGGVSLSNPAAYAAFHPNGEYVYFSQNDSNVGVCDFIEANGSCNGAVGVAAWAVAGTPNEIMVSPGGDFVYSRLGNTLDAQLRRMVIASDGAVLSNPNTVALSLVGFDNTILHPTKNLLFLHNNVALQPEFNVYSVGGDGSALALGDLIPATLGDASALAFSGDGKRLMIFDFNQLKVRGYPLNALGKIGAGGTFTLSHSERKMATNEDGSRLYFLGNDGTDSVLVYATNPSTGVPDSPAPLSTVSISSTSVLNIIVN